LSISVGLACSTPGWQHRHAGGTDAPAGEALFRAADAALYLAKESGRNHVCVA